MEKSKCKNCLTDFKGHFCSKCGQRNISNKRLKFYDIVADFFDNVLNLHKGLFYTFWNLIIKPGEVGLAYIGGQRKRFTNPVRYLIIAVAIQAFLDYWFIHPELNRQPDFLEFPFLSENTNKSMAIWNHTLAVKHSFLHNLSMILIFPISFLVIFRKLKYNFTELLTVNFYYFSTGLILTISTILIYVLSFDHPLPIPIIILITMSYVIWTSMDFFKEVKFWERIIKVLTAMVIFIFFRVFLVVYILSLLFPML